MTGFLMFLAAGALPVASALLGAQLAGAGERPVDSDAPPLSRKLRVARGWTFLQLAIVIIGSALILIEPAVIQPLWAQYLWLFGLPLVIGAVLRVAVARYLASRS